MSSRRSRPSIGPADAIPPEGITPVADPGVDANGIAALLVHLPVGLKITLMTYAAQRTVALSTRVSLNALMVERLQKAVGDTR